MVYRWVQRDQICQFKRPRLNRLCFGSRHNRYKNKTQAKRGRLA